MVAEAKRTRTSTVKRSGLPSTPQQLSGSSRAPARSVVRISIPFSGRCVWRTKCAYVQAFLKVFRTFTCSSASLLTIHMELHLFQNCGSSAFRAACADLTHPCKHCLFTVIRDFICSRSGLSRGQRILRVEVCPLPGRPSLLALGTPLIFAVNSAERAVVCIVLSFHMIVQHF